MLRIPVKYNNINCGYDQCIFTVKNIKFRLQKKK